ncbi:hypothetical protein NDU88_000938 [Pleurodeles waltl]|uniref:Uncharacterized protein n=1 Tax=Pleurodeles waltl TaxID=8319 RepID=A0AAV7USM6_PLEWA|nr:hypothetical protein NDU88_000938 [Pleurodeles waltl]
MEARCTALAVRVAKQKSRHKPKIPSAVQVRALVRKEIWDPYTWDGTVSDNDWNWEDEVEVRVAELGPDVEPVTAGIRARLIRNAPPHMRGALLALLGPAQGRPVGDVVLLMAQLEGLDRQKSARAVGKDDKYKGGESTIKVTKRQMWIDLLNAGMKKEDIDGKPTSYLLNKCKALQRRQKEKEAFDKKQPSAPPLEDSRERKDRVREKQEGACLNSISRLVQRWLGSPRAVIMKVRPNPRSQSSARGNPRGQAAICTSYYLLAKRNTTCYGTARYRCGNNSDKW